MDNEAVRSSAEGLLAVINDTLGFSAGYIQVLPMNRQELRTTSAKPISLPLEGEASVAGNVEVRVSRALEAQVLLKPKRRTLDA